MKILIVRIGRLGDIVMILPAIKEIREKYPTADIYALTSADGSRLLKVSGFNSNNIHCYSNHFLKRPHQEQKVNDFLEHHQFDMVFCFEKKKRTVSWLPPKSTIINDHHAGEHYALRCQKLINPNPEPIRSSQYLSANGYDISSELSKHGIRPDTLLIGLHPTYSGSNKWGRAKEKRHRQWPTQSFINLISTITNFSQKCKFDVRFIMDLLPQDKRFGERMLSSGATNLILLCRPPNFHRYLAYLNRLNVLVAPNTGVMHLSAALNTATVALFSNADPGDCGPYMHPDRFCVIRAHEFASNNISMASIPVRPVANAILSLLPIPKLELEKVYS